MITHDTTVQPFIVYIPTITGTVTDTSLKQPLSNVKIIIHEGTFIDSTYTNTLGKYTINIPPVGDTLFFNGTITASLPHYNITTAKVIQKQKYGFVQDFSGRIPVASIYIKVLDSNNKSLKQAKVYYNGNVAIAWNPGNPTTDTLACLIFIYSKYTPSDTIYVNLVGYKFTPDTIIISPTRDTVLTFHGHLLGSTHTIPTAKIIRTNMAPIQHYNIRGQQVEVSKQIVPGMLILTQEKKIISRVQLR